MSEEQPRAPTPASVWRTAVGRRLGALYAAQPNVAAMLVGGSAARGISDGYSDLELGVFWHAPPTDAATLVGIQQSFTDALPRIEGLASACLSISASAAAD